MMTRLEMLLAEQQRKARLCVTLLGKIALEMGVINEDQLAQDVWPSS